MGFMTLKGFLLAGACLSAWAAPLSSISGSTVSPGTRDCDRQVRAEIKPTTGLESSQSNDTGQQCPTPVGNVEGDASFGTLGILYEDADPKMEEGGTEQRRSDGEVQSQGTWISSIANSSVDERQATAPVSARPEFLTGEDQTRLPRDETVKGVSSATSEAAASSTEDKRITAVMHTGRSTMPTPSPSTVQSEWTTDGHGESQMAPGKSDLMQSGVSLDHDGEPMGTKEGPKDTKAPLEGDEAEWKAETPQDPFRKSFSSPDPGSPTRAFDGPPSLVPTSISAAAHPSQTSTPLSAWSLTQDDVSLLPSSEEVGPDPTMSSEDLPLIFEPFDDDTAGAVAFTGQPTGSMVASQPSAHMEPGEVESQLGQMVTVDADQTLSEVPAPGGSEWLSSWQTSGAELLEAVSTSHPLANTPLSEPMHITDHGRESDADIPQNPGGTSPTSPSLITGSAQQNHAVTVTRTTHKPASGLEELESEEEHDEDEEDEEIEDSEEEDDDEEESEEDQTESPASAPTRPPYSLIPPPPVWVQRNQGLVRSWVELIREKAGYVSGMLAPVGIGIAGALLIVGALYSVRMIHRKRRNSFKHQRRKPREVRHGQDQAMLLADSSEDEF
ncbi:armadillo-like helical domain-containing protein 4 isoform X3 [Denticeps clupeoides]|uniref:armadillo-like helical domain-containing protein 4 isoform X3 n=1 Tax=Denticeps clupeoides TaxID=299321 RepID=UPI0010A41B2B|nr:armadillo-like helical domain-containing protein 4 isoform X3 [Denticeps clupeoides]